MLSVPLWGLSTHTPVCLQACLLIIPFSQTCKSSGEQEAVTMKVSVRCKTILYNDWEHTQPAWPVVNVQNMHQSHRRVCRLFQSVSRSNNGLSAHSSAVNHRLYMQKRKEERRTLQRLYTCALLDRLWSPTAEAPDPNKSAASLIPAPTTSVVVS